MKVADINWNTWVPEETATLMFVIKDEQILLIRKKRGLGAGKNKPRRDHPPVLLPAVPGLEPALLGGADQSID